MDAEWLLTGNGEMLKSDISIPSGLRVTSNNPMQHETRNSRRMNSVVRSMEISSAQEVINKELNDKLDELQKEIKKISKSTPR